MLKIHGLPISVHVRKTIATAHFKNIPFTLVPVAPFDPPENWRTLSPTGLIPAITDDEFTLADSTVIAQYLDRAYPGPAISPADLHDFARALWFDSYAGQVVFRTIVHPLFWNLKLAPMLQRPADPAIVDGVIANVVPGVFEYLEGVLDGPFLVGDRLTLADLAIASNLVNFRYLGFDIDGATYPRLQAYFRHIVRQPVMAKTLADEAPFVTQMALDDGFLTEG